MAASKQDIREWFQRGVERRATHMIVVCDGYDSTDFPVYVEPEERVREREQFYKSRPMLRVMEVYAMHLDMEAQLAEERAFHYDAPPAAESAASPETFAMLQAGIESAKSEPLVDLGSFAKYADEDE